MKLAQSNGIAKYLGGLRIALQSGTAALAIFAGVSAHAEDTKIVDRVVALPSFWEGSAKKELRQPFFDYLGQTAQPSSRVTVYDGGKVRLLGSFTVPEGPFKSRIRKLSKSKESARHFASVMHHFKQAYVAPTDPASRPFSNLQVPQLLNEIATQQHIGTLAEDERICILIIGEAEYRNPAVWYEDMTGGWVPPDFQVLQPGKGFLFGTVDRPEMLKGYSIYYAHAGTNFENEEHLKEVQRFWKLFVEKQGGELVSFSANLTQVLEHFAACQPGDGGLAEVDPRLLDSREPWKPDPNGDADVSAGGASRGDVFLEERPEIGARGQDLEKQAKVEPVAETNLTVAISTEPEGDNRASREKPAPATNNEKPVLSKAAPALATIVLSWGHDGCGTVDLDLHVRRNSTEPFLNYATENTGIGEHTKFSNARTGVVGERVELEPGISPTNLEILVNHYGGGETCRPNSREAFEAQLTITWPDGSRQQQPMFFSARDGGDGGKTRSSAHWFRVGAATIARING